MPLKTSTSAKTAQRAKGFIRLRHRVGAAVGLQVGLVVFIDWLLWLWFILVVLLGSSFGLKNSGQVAVKVDGQT
ncbi:MAG: hypothetical protein NTZ16_14345 [Verrucomicrobia bacterium]|nr:hypothetical protein [Verrucomicrobiota bacterium]